MKSLYIFSLLGFFLVPGGLGRWTWLLPGGFAGLNLFLFFAPESLQPRQNPWVYFLFAQLPGILFCLDLIGKGKASRIVEGTPLRQWILWPVFRFMGTVYFFAMVAGDLPPEFAFRAAFSDFVTGFGALALWAHYRPERAWYRGLLLFWNSYGFISALATGVALLRAHPAFPWGNPSLEVHGYFMAYPRAWIPLFWMPLSLCVHAVIFFRLYASQGLESAEKLPLPDHDQSPQPSG